MIYTFMKRGAQPVINYTIDSPHACTCTSACKLAAITLQCPSYSPFLSIIIFFMSTECKSSKAVRFICLAHLKADKVLLQLGNIHSCSCCFKLSANKLCCLINYPLVLLLSQQLCFIIEFIAAPIIIIIAHTHTHRSLCHINGIHKLASPLQ